MQILISVCLHLPSLFIVLIQLNGLADFVILVNSLHFISLSIFSDISPICLNLAFESLYRGLQYAKKYRTQGVEISKEKKNLCFVLPCGIFGNPIMNSRKCHIKTVEQRPNTVLLI